MHVGIATPLWLWKRSLHSRRMRNTEFYVSAPIKTARLKNKVQYSITRDIVKLMYKKGGIDEPVVKKKDTVLMKNYRKLRNNITGMITHRKGNSLTRLAIHFPLVLVHFGSN